MAVTYTDLTAFINSDTGDLAETAIVEDCFNQAVILVDKFIGSATVPVAITDRAYLEVGADLWYRRSAPNGITNQQFALADGSFGGQAVRITRDPMASVYKLLAPYISPWAAPTE